MPTATSPCNFLLRHPTEEELVYIRTLHAACWAGNLTVPQYLAREEHIASTPLTRDGGLTQWVLVDSSTSEPHILASCEAIRKIAAMSFPPVDGEKIVPVKEVVAYGIGSVFTPPDYRGKGYARVMLTMLGDQLKRHNGVAAGFSVLYSDIGKDFYAKLGWLPHRSSHIEIPVHFTTPSSSHFTTPSSSLSSRVQPLFHDDIAALCDLDIASVKSSLATRYSKPRIAFLPNHDTLDWHHSREEFISSCVCPTLGIPKIKGSITADGKRWVMWGRDFSPKDTKLYILRIVDLGGEEGRAEDIDILLRAAVEEARNWGLKKVCVWNPVRWVIESAKRVVGGEVKVEDRVMDSIASLMMYGEEKVGSGIGDVEWVVNEKFAWC